MSRRRLTADEQFDMLVGSFCGFFGIDFDEDAALEDDLLRIVERRGGPDGVVFAQNRRARSAPYPGEERER